MRLQKFLAQAGVASRRASERLIREGRVAVNGQTVTVMGWKVDPARDRVTVDGRPVALPQAEGPGGGLVYIMLHKPSGVLSGARDDRGRITATEWVRRRGGPSVRLFPVGRLDLDSEGLLLLTNDGQLAYGLTHPSRQVPKSYRVVVQGAVTDEALEALRRGVVLEDGPTAPAGVRLIRRTRRSSELEITIHEGRKRQVRRMCRAVGFPVRRLVRMRIGPLELGRLPRGAWRYLTPEEVRLLQRACGAGEPFTASPAGGSISPKTQDGRTEGRQAPAAG